jgi:hypothetical protein
MLASGQIDDIWGNEPKKNELLARLHNDKLQFPEYDPFDHDFALLLGSRAHNRGSLEQALQYADKESLSTIILRAVWKGQKNLVEGLIPAFCGPDTKLVYTHGDREPMTPREILDKSISTRKEQQGELRKYVETQQTPILQALYAIQHYFQSLKLEEKQRTKDIKEELVPYGYYGQKWVKTKSVTALAEMKQVGISQEKLLSWFKANKARVTDKIMERRIADGMRANALDILKPMMREVWELYKKEELPRQNAERVRKDREAQQRHELNIELHGNAQQRAQLERQRSREREQRARDYEQARAAENAQFMTPREIDKKPAKTKG